MNNEPTTPQEIIKWMRDHEELLATDWRKDLEWSRKFWLSVCMDDAELDEIALGRDATLALIHAYAAASDDALDNGDKVGASAAVASLLNLILSTSKNEDVLVALAHEANSPRVQMKLLLTQAGGSDGARVADMLEKLGAEPDKHLF